MALTDSATDDRTRASIPESLLHELVGALMAVTPSGEILSWNDGAERLFGFSAAEAIGRSFYDLIVPAQQVAMDTAHLAAAASHAGAVGYEALRRRRNGTMVDVEVVYRPLYDAQETMYCIVVNQRDITALKYQRQAQVLEAKFRGLLEAAPDAMVIVDQTGRIALVNSQVERLFAYSRIELLGQPVEILVPEQYRGSHPGHRTGYFHSPAPRPMGAGLELSGRRKDGSEFPAEISLSPMEIEEGRFATAAIRDVSDRREQYFRIQEANRLKSEFLANMSHELRTPLNAVIGFAEIMHDGRAGPVNEDQKEYLGDILTSSRHLLRIINDVLDLAKVEAGRILLAPEAVDAGQLVQEVLEVMRTTIAARGMEVHTMIAPEVEHLVIDPARLKQILYNYLSNALKFTADGGRIVIRFLPESPDLFRLDIEDTGIGIAREALPTLFVPFRQLDSSVRKKFQGTGLGLALTRQLAEAMGGQVGVTSVPGAGSTFFAVLPRAPRGPAGSLPPVEP